MKYSSNTNAQMCGYRSLWKVSKPEAADSRLLLTSATPHPFQINFYYRLLVKTNVRKLLHIFHTFVVLHDIELNSTLKDNETTHTRT